MREFCCVCGVMFGLLWVPRPAFGAPPGADASTDRAAIWTRWERRLEGHGSPETEVRAEFAAPSGAQFQIDGFWDGGHAWRLRFMPSEQGLWKYQVQSHPQVEGLHGIQGEFVCGENEGATSLDRHGAVQVSQDGRHLQHADGTPFFWLGDTAWNGALLSQPEDWNSYLADRREKQFTAIQFVTTQWRTAYQNAEGEVAYTGRDNISIQPEFFQRMDQRIDAINAHGLLAAPVVLWALGDPEYTPGKLPTAQAIRLARYIVARYGANHVLWFLGGDENYGSPRAEHWKQIGRAVFQGRPHAPATLHPQGMQWPFDGFGTEEWLDLLIYQSGHGDDPGTLAWIHSGPPATKWQTTPARPVINSEPPYEGHVAYQSKQPHGAYNVRRAAYWSLLNAPTAGVSYGAHGVWSWQKEPGVPLNHGGSGIAQPWQHAAQMPGSTHMQHLARLLTSVAWWTLSPDPELVLQQPAPNDAAQFVAAARSASGDLAVVYLPVGGEISIALNRLHSDLPARWFDPRTGTAQDATMTAPGTFVAPDTQDWVWVLGSQGSGTAPAVP